MKQMTKEHYSVHHSKQSKISQLKIRPDIRVMNSSNDYTTTLEHRHIKHGDHQSEFSQNHYHKLTL